MCIKKMRPRTSVGTHDFVLRPWKRLQEALPPLSTYERALLAESIRKYGIINPIIVLPDGRIIDGTHRFEIANEIGYEIPKDKIEIKDLDEDEAFLLGIKLNIGRRQLSPEQIRELREKQKKAALELRKRGMTQEEVARIAGVPRQTISYWERNVSNASIGNAYTSPDLRIKVPADEYTKIYERYKSGETQKQLAADYKVSRARIAQIIKIVEECANSGEEKEVKSRIPRFLARLIARRNKRSNIILKINRYANSEFADIIVERSLIEKYENGCLKAKELGQPIDLELIIREALEDYWRRFERALRALEQSNG